MLKFVVRLYKSAKMRLTWILCRFFRVRKSKIVFSNFYGRGWGDNAKYIAEKLLQSENKIRIIWIVNNDKEKSTLPAGIEYCKSDTIQMVYHLMTSGVWLDNCRKYFIMLKRKNQFYIQTWHGGGAQKRCELDALDKLDVSYKKMAVRDSANTDLMISDSRFMTNLYHRSFWYKGPVYECGYPRYDILFKHSETLISKVYNYFEIDPNKELVLYAPTFRADHSFKAYNIDFKRLCDNLKKRFGKDYVVLVHLHPNVACIEGGINYDGKMVINSTFYPDTQELIATSSILIGDYSSINYDFSLKRMPVFRYVSDLEEYKDDRDLYFSFDEYPYPYAQNNDELESLILNFDNEKYLENLDAFIKKLGAVLENDSSEKIANIILDYVHSKNKKNFFEQNKGKFIY